MLKFLLFLVIGLMLYPVFCLVFVFFKVFFGTNSLLKKLEEKVTVLAYDYKVFSMRKEYAEKNSINYTTPFAFKYSDDKVKIETEELSQLEFLNKLQNLEKDIDAIEEALDIRLKTSEPAVSYLKTFNSLKVKIREANPYVY